MLWQQPPGMYSDSISCLMFRLFLTQPFPCAGCAGRLQELAMSVPMPTLGSFGRRLRLWRRLAHHRKAFGPLDHRALLSTRRFSPSLRPTCWRANLANNPPHRPPHLPWTGWSRFRLPRSPQHVHLLAHQHQLIARRCPQIAPAFHLLRRPHSHTGPQQILFVEPIAMLLPEPPRIERRQLSQRWQRPTQPPEPAFAWVALGVLRALTDDPHHADRHGARPTQM